ncbi:MAG: HDOD domain-containing protein [Phycisphaeraceae bacterium]|nr:HDOD domain-containing protein [Phycisphaeraceae bacterium]
MTSKMLDRVLNCPTLPSLPGVAVAMLELLRQPSCTADKVANLIQNDPALASKVLKTVNSSYYGLSKPCPTISRAVSFLGMNTVKSLTLGLSLVDVGRSVDSGFDLLAYWRRSVYSAAAARIIAKIANDCDPDEVFVAALLQDVGMLASYSALGATYGAIMSAVSDHEDLASQERDQLGFDHAEVGSRLAEKWRLPDHIIACTKFHHRPDSAAASHAAIVKVVAASGEAAAALVAPETQPHVVAFRRRMREWFNVDGKTADELLHQTGEAAKALSKMLELDTGSPPDVGAILAEAGEQLIHHQVEMERRQTELARQAVTDALTGAFNRKHFDGVMAGAFSNAAAAGSALSVLFADADKFKSVNDTLGHQAGDAVLIEVARRLRETIGDTGTVCRYGGEEFAVVLPGVDPQAARNLAERLRCAIESSPIDVSHLDLSAKEVRQTISLGVSSNLAGRYTSWESLVHAADEAVYAAKKSGRNRVCCAWEATNSNAKQPKPADASLVLLVEDDALSAKMLEVLLTKHGKFKALVARSAEEALHLLKGGSGVPGVRPGLVMVDMSLPGMSGSQFMHACRADADLADLRCVAMSARGDEEQRDAASRAGSLGYFDKAQLCLNVGATLQQIADLAAGRAKAA